MCSVFHVIYLKHSHFKLNESHIVTISNNTYTNSVILPKQTIVRHMKNTTKLYIFKGVNNHWEFFISQLVERQRIINTTPLHPRLSVRLSKVIVILSSELCIQLLTLRKK